MGTDDPNDVELESEHAARFRAAFAYAGFPGPSAIGKALGVSDSTAKRLERGELLSNGKTRFTRELWDQVIALTGVPPWFVEQGFSGVGLPDETRLAERTEALESQMRTVLNLLSTRVSSAAGSASTHVEPREDPADAEATDPQP